MSNFQSSLPYYDHNSRAYLQRSGSELPLEALRAFTGLVPPGGLVLDAGCGGGRDLSYFRNQGFRADGVDGSASLVAHALGPVGQDDQGSGSGRVWQGDLMMISLARESYDGIWCHRVLPHFSPEATQRVVASFFKALKPKGILFATFEEGSDVVEDRLDDPSGPARFFYRYAVDDVASLLRQQGFQAVSLGRDLGCSFRFGVLARRL